MLTAARYSLLCCFACASSESESDAADTRVLELRWKGIARDQDNKRPCQVLIGPGTVAAAYSGLREGAERHQIGPGCADLESFFYFYIFQNRFLHKYIFGFIIYRFIPLPPGRGAAGGLPPPSRVVGTYM